MVILLAESITSSRRNLQLSATGGYQTVAWTFGSAVNLFRDEIFDEAGASQDGGAKGPRERAHGRTIAPSVLGSRQLQADFVFEHVRRQIGFDVQRPPQGRPHAVLPGAATCLSCMAFSLLVLGYDGLTALLLSCQEAKLSGPLEQLC
jgi:hypothetical protein